MLKGKHIWLIGASEGIGRALALQLAEAGAQVAISARSQKRLNSLYHEMDGKEHLEAALDVTDAESVSSAFHTIHNRWGQLDMVIYNAGDYTPMAANELNAENAIQTTDINLNGAYRVLEHVIPVFTTKKAGHIVLVASIAGLRGLPKAMGYGASKAAVIHLAENMKIDLEEDNIHVQVVNPGFVRTRLTDKNSFDMPVMIEPEVAASHILKGIQTPKRFDIHFPKRFTRILKLCRLLPYPAYFWVIRRFVSDMNK